MVLILNESGKTFNVVFQGQEYNIVAGEPIEIPDMVAKLYFAYGIEPLTTDVIHWCCNRFRLCNPQYSSFGDKQIWDEILSKVVFGKDVLKKSRTR